MEITYDAWGNFTDTISDLPYPPSTEQLQALEIPFRYRGYYYDQDTGFYYLNSRYYDSKIGRFINADDISYLGANNDMSAFNLYAYCSNNPVMYVDYYGNASEFWNKFEESNKKSILAKIALCIVGIYYLSEETDIKVFDDLSEDITNFSMHNSDEQKVIEANIFSMYNGAFVIKSDLLGNNAFSFGVMVIGNGDKISTTDIKHEYGHAIQFAMLGRSKYCTCVAIPSLLGFWRGVEYKDYYSQPWEYGADLFSGAKDIRTNNSEPYNYHPNAYKNHKIYWNLIN